MRIILPVFAGLIFYTNGLAQTGKQASTVHPTITIATDPGWEVSGQQVRVGEYPLSAEKIATATAPLQGGTVRAVAAAYSKTSKVIPGTVPIWRNARATVDGEAYQFRRTVRLGSDRIKKATLEINCDDVARVYINKRLVSVDKRDGTLKDGYDDWYTFRSLSGFTANRIYTYDVTDYFFTNVNNTILAEVASLAFDGNHAYLSLKIVIEFEPAPERPKPTAAKPKPASEPQAKVQAPEEATRAAQPAAPNRIVFEAGRDPEIEKLRVGSVLELGNVYFKANEYTLDPRAHYTLDALAAFLKRHPGLKIEIGGHTNLRPNESYAAGLSTNRARTVMEYLVGKGVAADRLTHKGYGKSQPRVNAVSTDADRKNQRVEVVVVEK